MSFQLEDQVIVLPREETPLWLHGRVGIVHGVGLGPERPNDLVVHVLGAFNDLARTPFFYFSPAALRLVSRPADARLLSESNASLRAAGAEVAVSLSELLEGGPDGNPPIEPRFDFQ